MDRPSIQEVKLMTWNPFDWTAGPFLALYLTIAVTVFSLAFRVRSMIGPTARDIQKLSVLELAYLGGGARRLGDAVLLRLASGNAATIAPKGHTITVTDQTPLATLMGRPPLLSLQQDMTRQQFQTAIEPIVERVQGRLQKFGYYPSDHQMTSFRMIVLPFVGLLLVFGLIKVMVGAERHHPVEILVLLLVFTTFAGFALAKRPTRTRAGKEVLQTYQASHVRASRAPLDHELPLAVALSGAVVLSGTAYASVYAASQTMNSGGDSGGCGGGGGGCGGCS
jgi:uncharacterized protein (TIGR04222 family)